MRALTRQELKTTQKLVTVLYGRLICDPSHICGVRLIDCRLRHFVLESTPFPGLLRQENVRFFKILGQNAAFGAN